VSPVTGVHRAQRTNLNELAPSTGNIQSGRSTLWLIFRYRIRGLWNTATNLRSESLLKVFVVGGLGIVFWAGLFLIFLQFFDFINAHAAFFRPVLTRHILGLFFVALIFMLIFSNAVISFHSLFRAPETNFLFALPMRHDTIFMAKLLESMIFSSWAVFAAGIPLLFAFGIKAQVEWFFYPIVLVFLVPFVMLPAAIGSTLGLLITAVVPRHGGKVLVTLALLLIIPSVYLVATLLNLQASKTAYGLEMQATFGSVLGRLGFTQHFMMPNYWITEALLGISENKPDAFQRASVFYFAICASALFALSLGWFISGWLYEGAFSIATSGESRKRKVRSNWLTRATSYLQQRNPDIMILLIKDIKTFFRDASQWSQVLVFFGILTLYIGNLQKFSYPLKEPFYLNLISFLNLGATCMTLATMTSRFIFPLISLEGRRFWVLGLVPLQRRSIMMAKFYFALCGSLMLTTALILLSNYILDSSWFVLGMQLFTGVLISFSLSGLCVGMGALFPSFGERNPSKIVSGFGGTLTLILSISLVITSTMGEGLVCHYCLVPTYTGDTTASTYWNGPMLAVMLGICALNITAAYLPMRLGIRALEQVEF
jgi:ABC-2 type transport system permease protein